MKELFNSPFDWFNSDEVSARAEATRKRDEQKYRNRMREYMRRRRANLSAMRAEVFTDDNAFAS